MYIYIPVDKVLENVVNDPLKCLKSAWIWPWKMCTKPAHRTGPEPELQLLKLADLLWRSSRSRPFLVHVGVEWDDVAHWALQHKTTFTFITTNWHLIDVICVIHNKLDQTFILCQSWGPVRSSGGGVTPALCRNFGALWYKWNLCSETVVVSWGRFSKRPMSRQTADISPLLALKGLKTHSSVV